MPFFIIQTFRTPWFLIKGTNLIKKQRLGGYYCLWIGKETELA
jgi:hypothetical protein